MKITVSKPDGMVYVDGVGRKCATSDLAGRCVQFDTVKGTGHVEYDDGDLVKEQVRDVDAETEACAAARAAGQPEPTDMMFKTVEVRRQNATITSFGFQIYLNRWTNAVD